MYSSKPSLTKALLTVISLTFLSIVTACDKENTPIEPEEINEELPPEATLLTESGHLNDTIKIELKNIEEADILRVCIASSDNINGIGGCSAIKFNTIIINEGILSFVIDETVAWPYIEAMRNDKNKLYFFLELDGFEEISVAWTYNPFEINQINKQVLEIQNDSLIFSVNGLRPDISFFLFSDKDDPADHPNIDYLLLNPNDYQLNDTSIVLTPFGYRESLLFLDLKIGISYQGNSKEYPGYRIYYTSGGIIGKKTR